MKCEQREKIISTWLFELLKRYEVPSHFDDDSARKEMVLMVQDINSELPLIDEKSLIIFLEKVGKYIRKNQVARRWPTINILMKGIKYTISFWPVDQARKALDCEKGFDEEKINSKRILNKESIGEYWVFGKGAEILINKLYITKDDLLPYLQTRGAQ